MKGLFFTAVRRAVTKQSKSIGKAWLFAAGDGFRKEGDFFAIRNSRPEARGDLEVNIRVFYFLLIAFICVCIVVNYLDIFVFFDFENETFSALFGVEVGDEVFFLVEGFVIMATLGLGVLDGGSFGGGAADAFHHDQVVARVGSIREIHVIIDEIEVDLLDVGEFDFFVFSDRSDVV